ncbi:hypothetical protein F4808DRAFT_468091 [Astrocystis sublimbata]|nr:hypothetical protein F4808DRAFT_468091 [Astrocystis sublimbata]
MFTKSSRFAHSQPMEPDYQTADYHVRDFLDRNIFHPGKNAPKIQQDAYFHDYINRISQDYIFTNKNDVQWVDTSLTKSTKGSKSTTTDKQDTEEKRLYNEAMNISGDEIEACLDRLTQQSRFHKRLLQDLIYELHASEMEMEDCRNKFKALRGRYQMVTEDNNKSASKDISSKSLFKVREAAESSLSPVEFWENDPDPFWVCC